MKKIFYNDEFLEEYEQQEKWDKCIEHLLNLFHKYPLDKSILFRLAAESWYVLTFWDCNMPTNKLNRSLFESALETSYLFAKEKIWSDQDCLWLFGYFMSINQMDFSYVNEDCGKVEQYGNDLICKAHFEKPKNKFAEILYLADNGKSHKYILARKKARKNIRKFFPTNSSVDQYFTEIFSVS